MGPARIAMISSICESELPTSKMKASGSWARKRLIFISRCPLKTTSPSKSDNPFRLEPHQLPRDLFVCRGFLRQRFQGGALIE